MHALTVETGELCQKGYARMNEFQAHESSYDHSHRLVRTISDPVVLSWTPS